MQNKHGLSRDIPEGVKRLVRQRDGFGCVCCGNAIVEYEHFDPEFADATAHNPDGIILLCDGCHRKKGRFLSRETIARAAHSPKCKQQGFSRGPFDVGSSHPEIVIGTVVCQQVDVLLQVLGENLLSVHPPEELCGPFRISAKINDAQGQTLLNIVENEWRPSTQNWDVEVVGPRITVRTGAGKIALVIRSDPPHRIIFERVDLEHRGLRVVGREGANTIIFSGGNTMSVGTTTLRGCKIAIQANATSLVVGVGGGMMFTDSAHISSGVGNPIHLSPK